METTLHKHKWFWGWDDDREEAWLRQMAQSGWHLKTAAPFGLYTFISGPKLDVLYRLDFQPYFKKEARQEYFLLFQDAGWEHVAEMANWQYFRKPASVSGSSDIFTDNSSKIQKYRRLSYFLTLFLVIILTQFNSMLLSTERHYNWFIIPQVLYSVILILYVYVLARLVLRINQLKKKL